MKTDLVPFIIDEPNKMLFIRFHLIPDFIQAKLSEILSDCHFSYVNCATQVDIGFHENNVLGNKGNKEWIGKGKGKNMKSFHVNPTYRKPCEGFVGIHVSNIKGMKESNIPDYVDKFDAACSLYFYTNIIEVYDVCVKKSSRGKGVLNDMFASIIIQAENKYHLWLGVDPHNTYWDTVLHSYTKFGFIDPYITFKTTQQEDIPITIGFFRRYKPTLVEIEAARKKANELRKQILQESLVKSMELDFPKNTCENQFSMSRELLLYFFSQLLLDVEFGGNLRTMDGKLVLYFKDMTEGSKETFSVDFMPKTRIIYHTHPRYAYEDQKTYLGWPSSQDMKNTFSLYYIKGVVLHLVITVEGIYFIHLNPWFQKSSRHISKKCRVLIEQIIFHHFLYNSEVAEVNRAKPFPEQQFNNYFRFVNNFTFNELLHYASADLKKCKIIVKPHILNQPIFQVNFYSWHDLGEENNFTFKYHFYISNKDKYKNIGCALPEENFHTSEKIF